MSAPSNAQAPIYGAIPGEGAMRLAVFAFLAIAGSWLLAVSGQIKVPFYPVPATLQTLVIFMIGATYGMRLAGATVLLYLAQGAVGLPVFTGGAGLAYMMGPTGGFLAGFVVAAVMIGWAADRGWARNPFKLFAVTLVAATVLMALGYAWLSGLIGPETAWLAGVQPFLLSELTKVVLASALVPALAALFRRR